MKAKENGKELSTSVGVPYEKDVKKNSFCHTEKEMIRFKAHYFVLFGALGAMLPYVPLISKDSIGISATSHATVLTSQLFFMVLSKIALGYIADYFKRLKTMMSVLIIMNGLFTLSLLFIPKIDISTNLKQNSIPFELFQNCKNGTALTTISLYNSTICNVSSSYNHNLSQNIKNKIEKIEHSKNGNMFPEKKSSIIYVAKSNLTEKTFCFESNNNTEDRKLLENHFIVCCSKDSMPLEQVLTIIKMIKNILHLHPLNLEFCDNFTASKLLIATFLDNSTSTEKHPDINDFKTYQFWLYVILMIFAGASYSSVSTLSDTICCESVQKYNSDFGKQRVYSAIGYGLVAPLGGLLYDITNNFYSTWMLMAVLQILTIWNLYKMDLVIPQFSQNLTKDIGKVLKSRTFIAFNAGAFISGIWAGLIWYYLIWFASSLGASTFLCGLIPYVQCFAGEIPFMFFSGWFIKKLGHFNVLSLSLLSYAVRFLWYSYLLNPWLVLPMEIVHGITYGVFYPTLASFSKLNAIPGTEATTQSILYSTHEGLGAGIGCVLAGIGFDQFGSHKTFFYFSILAFISTFLNVCSTLLFRKYYENDKDSSSPPKVI